MSHLSAGFRPLQVLVSQAPFPVSATALAIARLSWVHGTALSWFQASLSD